MTVRLVDAGWGAELTDAIRADTSEIRIICPFIKVGILDRLLSLRPDNVQVITRHFAGGDSDVAKVDELTAFCDRLEASLATVYTTRSNLLETLLYEALEIGPLTAKGA